MPAPIVSRSLEELRRRPPKRSAVTLGVFDGVHLGHQRIIAELLNSRKRSGIEQCHLVTFDPHPLAVTHSRMTPPVLTTIEERVSLLSHFDLDGVTILKFDENVARLDYRVFLDGYLIRPFDMKHLVLGYDCHFGRGREGSPERVRKEGPKHGISVSVVPAVSIGEEIISSTAIRNALIEGNLEKANALSGHPYLLTGRVIRGDGMGKGLGYPTANLMIADPLKLRPPRGVYAVRVEVDGRLFDGMMNVGRAPTLKSLPEESREAEVHLFDFDEDVYGRDLRIFCCSYLRSEHKFGSADELARQLDRDRASARERLRRCGSPYPGAPGGPPPGTG